MNNSRTKGGEGVKPGQEELVRVFGSLGTAGVKSHLGDYVLDMAVKEKGKSWRDFLNLMEDGREMDWLQIYCRSMDDAVLMEMIKGTLPARLQEDEELRKRVGKYHKLNDWPQVYVSFSCREEFGGQPSQVRPGEKYPKAGWGPSIRKILSVLRTMEAYVREDCQDQEMIRGIDNAFPNMKKSGEEIWGRKYLRSQEAIRKMTEWILLAIDKFIDMAWDMSAEETGADLPWTMCEVGFGERGFHRAKQHERQESTNYLFGLWTAVLEHLWRGEYVIKTYAVMDVLAPEHANFCEKLGHLLLGSYMFEGGFGLNPALAGGLSIGDGKRGLRRGEMEPLWKKVQDEAIKKTVWSKSQVRDEEKLKESQAVKAKDKEVVKRKLEELEDEKAEVEQELQELQERSERRVRLASALAKKTKK